MVCDCVCFTARGGRRCPLVSAHSQRRLAQLVGEPDQVQLHPVVEAMQVFEQVLILASSVQPINHGLDLLRRSRGMTQSEISAQKLDHGLDFAEAEGDGARQARIENQKPRNLPGIDVARENAPVGVVGRGGAQRMVQR